MTTSIPYGNITLTTGMWNGTSSATSWTSPAYTINAASTSATSPVQISQAGITLDGNSDLVIGGTSIKQTLANIESRLALLRPSPELEAEWVELKRLGDDYRKLESDIKEKMKTWDTLNRKFD